MQEGFSENNFTLAGGGGTVNQTLTKIKESDSPSNKDDISEES